MPCEIVHVFHRIVSVLVVLRGVKSDYSHMKKAPRWGSFLEFMGCF